MWCCRCRWGVGGVCVQDFRTPLRQTPLRRTAQNFVFFSSLSGASSRGICHSALGPPGFHDNPLKHAHSKVPALEKHHQNSTNNESGRGKKREILGPSNFGATLRRPPSLQGPNFRGPSFSGLWATRIGQKWIGINWIDQNWPHQDGQNGIGRSRSLPPLLRHRKTHWVESTLANLG